MGFKFLSHTADLKIRAEGSSWEEAFSELARGMVDSITDVDKVKPASKQIIRINAKRMESLLYDFADQIIYMIDVDGFLVSKFEDFKIDEENCALSCTAIGDTYEEYESFGAIKSATYHEMVMKKEGNTYIIEMVLDI